MSHTLKVVIPEQSFTFDIDDGEWDESGYENITDASGVVDYFDTWISDIDVEMEYELDGKRLTW